MKRPRLDEGIVSVRFTCPYCRAVTFVEADNVDQTGPCRSCGRPVTVTSASLRGPLQTDYPDPNLVLKTTARGSGCGCCIAAASTIAFLTIPMLSAVVVGGTGRPANGELLRRALTAQGITLAISCVVGLAAGATVMGVSSALLRNSPRLLRHAQWGALLGAITAPILIFLNFSLPLVIQSGVTSIAVHSQLQVNWFYSLVGCAVGAIAGLLLSLLLALATGSNPHRRSNAQ